MAHLVAISPRSIAMAKVQSISDIYIDRSYYARALNLGTKPDGTRWRVIIRAKTKSGLATKLA